MQDFNDPLNIDRVRDRGNSTTLTSYAVLEAGLSSQPYFHPPSACGRWSSSRHRRSYDRAAHDCALHHPRGDALGLHLRRPPDARLVAVATLAVPARPAGRALTIPARPAMHAGRAPAPPLRSARPAGSAAVRRLCHRLLLGAAVHERLGSDEQLWRGGRGGASGEEGGRGGRGGVAWGEECAREGAGGPKERREVGG